MKRVTSIVWVVLVTALFALAGCQSGGGGGGSEGGSSGGGKEVSFKFKMPYYLSGVQAPAGGAQAFTASDVFTGTLAAIDPDTLAVIETFDWSIYLDEDTLDLQSNKTIVLPPGTYNFALLVSQGDHQYAGEALAVEIVDGENTVPLTVRPVIGDVTTNVSVVSRLIDLRFHYDPAEFSGAGIGMPRIGISVDGGTEQIFDVNPGTGFSEYMYLGLTPGDYHIELRLLNGPTQRGKSVDAQEDVTLSPGVNVNLDLVALHGEVVLALDESTGEATFQFNIPEEIVDEAGGTGDLEALFQIARSESAAQPGDEQALVLSGPTGGQYQATVSFAAAAGFQFEAVTIALSFTDQTDEYLIGSCNAVAELTTTPQAVDCGVTLVRRADITGNLLATLGVNVFTEEWEPVAGAVVRANGNVVGITGSGPFGTPGYLKVYLLAGSYTIHATGASMQGESPVTLTALGIDNVDVILDESLLYAFSGVQNNVPLADLSGWSVCMLNNYVGSGPSIATIAADCDKAKLMLACRPTGSSVLQVLAYAPRADVMFDTGTGNTPHDANGVGWYFNANYSWGFAPQGAPLYRSSCDVADSNTYGTGFAGDGTTNGQRLCWHTGGNALQGGWRCGGPDFLQGLTTYERLILEAD